MGSFDMYKGLEREVVDMKELTVDKLVSDELKIEEQEAEKEACHNSLKDYLKNKSYYDIPFEVLRNMSFEEIDRLKEIEFGHTMGFSAPKKTLKNIVMINICKYMNKHFGKEWVYDAEKEHIPGYIDMKEVYKKLNKFSKLRGL
jgi:hypothetical protein